ncbi:TIR domain-containing adapter molecule 1-like isoform X1 [Takifugu rubripes]|uniref:TIR domain-containing adapter molecule 1-like isoform X1 n=1 Tax=Takifugu rubripes TaxID=31033 RepID=UPI0011460575|nr:TIR domain-containing adapter molecule 1 isoform X1 [Takifugu rubripes]
MDLIHTFYCTFLDKNSQSKFLCYTRRTKGTFNICLTDVSNVWSADCTEDTVDPSKRTFALGPTEKNLQKLRSACLRGDVSVVVGDTSAELCGGSSPGDPRLKLSRLEPPQAGEELKELLFTMADRLSQAEGASVFSSPKKNQHMQPAESGAEQNSAPTLTPKKRPARTSLINPGTKKSHVLQRTLMWAPNCHMHRSVGCHHVSVPHPQTFAHPTQTFAHPTRTLAHLSQTLAHPTQTFAHPTRAFAHPTQTFAHPTQTLAHPTQTFAHPTQTLAHPTQTLAHPTQTLAHPTQTLAHPTQNNSPKQQRLAVQKSGDINGCERTFVFCLYKRSQTESAPLPLLL